MKISITCLTLVAALAASSLTLAGPKPAFTKVTSLKAAQVALAKYPGKVIGKIVLEDEEGHWQYAVNVRSGTKLREVMVDAKTGKIVNVEVTTRKDEAAEARAELSKSQRKTFRHGK